MSNIAWYALYTTPRAEKKVKERLDAQNIENYLPLHRTPRTWSDRIKMVDVPLFNSYIFVRCEEYMLFTLLKIYGVVKIVFYDGKPALIRDKEIDAIHEFIKLALERPLCTGEEVEIIAGTMKRVSGKIQKIHKTYILLYIEAMNATIAVNTDYVARKTLE